MRIISGIHGGRKIHPPSRMPNTRPTTDIAKEGLFNIIENNLTIPDLTTLDLFGGTGCISYELASRGAGKLTVIEKDPSMYQFITNTSRQLGFDFKVIKMDVFKYLELDVGPFDLIFAGPPYALKNIDELPLLIFSKNLLAKNGWFILEHTPANDYEAHPHFKTARNYGTTIFSFFINH